MKFRNNTRSSSTGANDETVGTQVETDDDGKFPWQAVATHTGAALGGAGILRGGQALFSAMRNSDEAVSEE